METTATPPATYGAAAPAQGAKPAVSSDFETFLQMLAVQLQNQDPLNPVEATDYAVQLATFSSVEQQVLTNELLGQLTEQQARNGMSGHAGWIGLEARSTAPARFDGTTPIELAPNPLVSADRAVLLVYNGGGAKVAEISVPVSAEPYYWNGQDGDGDVLPPGQYSFELENHKGDTLLATDALESYARVTEARIENGQNLIVLTGGVVVQDTAITGLREPVP
jgi:flagellar basal-body rod modification protein FlgD